MLNFFNRFPHECMNHANFIGAAIKGIFQVGVVPLTYASGWFRRVRSRVAEHKYESEKGGKSGVFAMHGSNNTRIREAVEYDIHYISSYSQFHSSLSRRGFFLIFLCAGKKVRRNSLFSS